MALTLRALHPWFGVEVLDVDVVRVDDATYRDIAEAFDQHSVLLFRGQRLDDREQIAFSERFGPLETTIRSIASQARTLPEISNLSNVDAEERLIPRATSGASSTPATGCGTATAPSSGFRPWPRYCRRARCRRRAARRSMPACAWPTID